MLVIKMPITVTMMMLELTKTMPLMDNGDDDNDGEDDDDNDDNGDESRDNDTSDDNNILIIAKPTYHYLLV